MPRGYLAILLGCALYMVAISLYAPLGPGAAAPARGLVTFASAIAGLGLLFAAATGLPARLFAGEGRRAWRRWLALALALPLCAGTLAGLTGLTSLVLTATPAQSYSTDVVSLTHEEARLALTGHNPYTAGESAYRDALARYPRALGTPLRGSVFGTGYDQPAPPAISVVQRAYVASPARVRGAFDPRTLHSYPALSFLLYVPWLWAGGRNIQAVHLLVYWALFAWLVWLAPIGWRHWAALVALAAVPTVLASLIESNEVVCVACVLLAWHLRERRWMGPLLLGLACAFKQYAWFFVPVFAVEVMRGQGWRAAIRWAVTGAGAFLLPNLPYLLASPHAWWESLWLPVSDRFFAVGVGIIQLSTSHLLPYGSPALYAALEALAIAGVVLIAARAWPRLGAGALVLALLPLFFAFRSTPNYFAFVPWLALYAVNVRARASEGAWRSPVVLAAARALRALSRGRADYWLLRAGVSPPRSGGGGERGESGTTHSA